MDLDGKRVIVVGLGKSGVSAAKLCLVRGARVIGTDRAGADALSEEARALDIELVIGGHQGVEWDAADLVVVSPGVPALAELDRAETAGVEVIGELELAFRFLRAPLLAVGGTNGKSTVTTLLGELLKAAGLCTFIGANLGVPACEAAFGSYDAVLFEVSSFQLERAPSLRPKISILLNVTEDHLDRYPSFLAYAEAKGNAFRNQTSEDVAVYFTGDPECERQARRGQGQLVGFGPGGDFVVEDRDVVERATGKRFSLAQSKLFGRHNLENAAAAIAAARAFGIGVEAIERGLSDFRPLAHRMELVAEIAGIRFYDDSKATNVGAAVTALDGLSENRAVLIAGGRDKLGSYAPLVESLLRKARGVVVLGEAAERIAAAIGTRLPIVRTHAMQEAVRAAYALAKPGDAVLLSPACSSFDMFEDYAERGRQFASAVKQLGSEEARR